jgi:uncharacterized repeat protein (TIGR01451 family)
MTLRTMNTKTVWLRCVLTFFLLGPPSGFASSAGGGTVDLSVTLPARSAVTSTLANFIDSTLASISYYVDSVGGNDTNSGLNEQYPMRSLTNATITNAIGVAIHVKRGSVFRQQVVLTNYGLTIAAYGAGAKPLISGADVLTNANFTKTACLTSTYQIPFGPFAWPNGFSQVTNTNVLMVWENKVRMGLPPFESSIANITSVDETPGSFFYTNGYIYVNASDSSDPATNRRLYEASTRTLAFVGGDNIRVEDMQTEEAYSSSSVGQQGWGFDAQGGGTYDGCEAYRGWDHLIGITSSFNDSVPLIFKNCYGYDCESGPFATATFVAYKGNLPIGVSNEVIFTNCQSVQPSLYAGGKTEAFFAHGVPDTNEWVLVQNCSSLNCDTVITIGNKCFCQISGIYGTNMQSGIIVNSNGQASISISNFIFSGATDQGIGIFGVTNTTVSFVNGTNLNCAVGMIIDQSPALTSMTNVTFASFTNGNWGIQSYGGSYNIYSYSNTFQNLARAYIGDGMQNFLLGSDYNIFGANNQVARNNPASETTLADWQSVSGMDAHSLSNVIAYPVQVDLSVTTTPSAYSPLQGQEVTFQLVLSNAGPYSVTTNITVTSFLSAGLQYVSNTGGAAYNASTGVWTVPGLPALSSASMSVTATASIAGVQKNIVMVEAPPGYYDPNGCNLAFAMVTVMGTNTQPKLSIQSGGNQIQLSWPSSVTNFVLLTTTDLASGVWTPVSNQPVGANATQTVTLGLTNAPQFFLLRMK